MEHDSQSKELPDQAINNQVALDVVFHPRSVAVIGTLDGPAPFGYYFTRCLMDFGFNGPIYPVNPSRENVLGLKAYRDMSHIPDPVDYVICCIPAPKIPSLLHDCHAREVKCVHIFSGRLSETGRKEAEDLETEILRQAKMLNIRLIGPNCMGIYYPREGLSFNYDLPKEEGPVGGLFQSGGLSIQFTRYGGLQGLRFSKVVSYGNGIDLDECEFLTYFAHDDETKIIVLYIEGVKDGKRFINTLRDVARIKPVIVMKGGRGIAGVKAAASHTASLGGSDVIWEGLFRQAGVTPAEDLNELVDLSVIFSSLPTLKGRKAAILGGGGGQSVVSADIFEAAGLEVPPLPSDMRDDLRERSPEIGDWIGNPIDFSAFAPFISFEDLLQMVAESPYFDFIIVNIDEGAPLQEKEWSELITSQVDTAIAFSRSQAKPVIVVFSGGKVCLDQFEDWRWRLLAGLRSRLISASIPTYSTVVEAAKAISKFVDFCQGRV